MPAVGVLSSSVAATAATRTAACASAARARFAIDGWASVHGAKGRRDRATARSFDIERPVHGLEVAKEPAEAPLTLPAEVRAIDEIVAQVAVPAPLRRRRQNLCGFSFDARPHLAVPAPSTFGEILEREKRRNRRRPRSRSSSRMSCVPHDLGVDFKDGCAVDLLLGRKGLTCRRHRHARGRDRRVRSRT